MLEKRTFVGGLDSDSEDRFLDNGDYRSLINGRNGISDKDAIGSIENVKGNTLISYTKPSGRNRVIGAFEDKRNGVVIYFVWNLDGNHAILEFDPRDRTITQVLQSSILNFQEDKNINHVNRVGDLLYWTDGVNPPRNINIQRAKDNGYPSPFTEQFIDAVKYAPLCPPTAEYTSLPNSTSNNLSSKLYQFKYKWVYIDNEESAWSSISSLPLPNFEHIYVPFGDNPLGSDNAINVSLETGSGIVSRIKIAARVVTNSEAPGDFNLVTELDKNIEGIPSDSTYTYLYDGDTTEIPIDLTDSNKLYDFLPLLAESQELIDGNRLTYGNTTSGYDNLDVKVSAQPFELFTPGGNVPTVNFPLSTDEEEGVLVFGDLFTTQQTFSGSISEGVTLAVSISVRISTSSYRTDYLSYTAKAGDTLSDAVQGLVDAINSSVSLNPPAFSKQVISGTLSETVTDQWDNSVTTLPVAVDNLHVEALRFGTGMQIRAFSNLWQFQPDGSLLNRGRTIGGFTGPGTAPTYLSSTIEITLKSKPRFSFKRGSSHPLGIVYYDKANRSGLVQESDDMRVFVPYFSPGDNGGIVGVRMEIRHQPPEWAKKYQIVYAGSVGVDRFLEINTGIVVSVANGLFTIELDTIPDFNEYITGGNLSYDFTEGDRLRVIKNTSDEFIVDNVDVEITSFDSGTNKITVKGHPSFAMTDAKIVELYTPTKESDRNLYFEMGAVYDILNPGEENRAHGGGDLGSDFGFIDQDQIVGLKPAIINVLDKGDVLMRFRDMDADGIHYIEDSSYSDTYTSSSWSKGRPNIVDKNIGQSVGETTISYSDKLIPNTNINGLSSFADLSFEEYDTSYGGIKKLYAEDGALILFQELKVGRVLVNEDVLFNNDGTPNGTVGQQNTVLGRVNYYGGEFGIGCNPESFAVYGNNKYFLDAQRGAVLRLGGNGITPISEHKMHTFFKDRIKLSIDSSDNFKAFGSFDVRFNEYILSFADIITTVVDENSRGGEPEEILIPGTTIAFNEDKSRWVTFYSFMPEYMVNTSISLITFDNGDLYVHNDSDTYNNFYGQQFTTKVTSISNENPSDIKFYTSIFTESTDVFFMPSATNQFGQKTKLISGDFEEKEGVFYANFLRDENTPNLSLPLLEGDDMRCHTMKIELENDSTEYQKLTAIGIRYSISMLTNR